MDVDGAIEAFEGLVNATAEPLFPSDVDTAIEDVDDLLTLLEAERELIADDRNVRKYVCDRNLFCFASCVCQSLFSCYSPQGDL